jgi:hypothetical protein
MTSRREAVERNALLRGEGRERTCRVSAIKVTNPSMPGGPAYAEIDILDPDDGFSDGNYELSIDRQVERLVKQDGKYKGGP